jgi:putative flippase GtrA
VEQTEPMNTFKEKIILKKEIKFAFSGIAAIVVDYVIYLLLVNRVFSETISNIISYSCGVVFNFFLHKRFVFELRRPATHAFALSMLISIGGLGISTAMVFFLSKNAFFFKHQYLTKLCSTAVVFFYNFFMKRFAFEKRFY